MNFHPNSFQTFQHINFKVLSDDSKSKNPPSHPLSDRSPLPSDPSTINAEPSNNPLDLSSKFKKSLNLSKASTSITTTDQKLTDLPQTKPLSTNTSRAFPSERTSKREALIGNRVRTLSAENKTKEGAGPLVLAESYLEQGHQDAENDDYIKALFNTLLAKKVIDDYLRKNWKFSFETLFITFYNLSAIHYKLRNFEECALYIKIALMNYQAHKVCAPLKTHGKSTWYNFNTIQDQASYLESVVTENVYKRYKCKIHLQGCIVNSQLGNSVEAFSHAVKAAKIACRLLFDSLLIAYHLYFKLKNSIVEEKKTKELDNIIKVDNTGIKTEEDEKTPKLGKSGLSDGNDKLKNNSKGGSPNDKDKEKSRSEWMEYFKKIIPILEEILEKVKGKKSNMPTADRPRLLFMLRKFTNDYQFKETNMQTLYEGLPSDHFLYTSNVMAIAQLIPIWTDSLKKGRSLQEVIEVDSLIEQIVLITVSVYCISTELRFWSNTKASANSPTSQSENPAWKKEPLSDTRLKEASELWVGRSVSLAFVYLPHDSLLAEQIFNIYSKIYDPTKITIPEDEEVGYHLKYLVPAKGINKMANSFIPVIKKDPADEIDGLEALLFLNKDLSESTTNILNEVKLFDTKAPFFELLSQNYVNTQQQNNQDFQGAFKSFLEKNARSSGRRSGNKSLTRISTKSPNRSDSSFSHLRRIYLPATQKTEDTIQIAGVVGNGNNNNRDKDKDKEKDKLKLIDEKRAKKKKEKEEEKIQESSLRVMTDPAPHENLTNSKDFSVKGESRPSVGKLRPLARLGFEDVKRNIQRKLAKGEFTIGSARTSQGSPGRPSEKESPIQVFHTEADFSEGEKSSRTTTQEVPKNMKHMTPVVGKNQTLQQLIGDVDQRAFIKAHLKSMHEGPARSFFNKSGVKEERSNSPNIMKRAEIMSITGGEAKKLKLRPKTAEKKRAPIGETYTKIDDKLVKRGEAAPLRGRGEQGIKTEEDSAGTRMWMKTSVDLEDMQRAKEREVKSGRSGSVGRGVNVVRKSEVMIKKSKRV